ncbi:NAD(P)H-quinone oxidoreductase subunit I, chloroplastic [Streptomyces canarius]
MIGLFEENCTVCMLCARECPDWCIYIDSHKETVPPAAPGGRERSRNVLDRFAIDFSLCMYCGICIEVCPFDALFWSPEFEYAETDIRELTHERDELPRVDVDRAGPARPGPRRGGAQGDHRCPQDRREAGRRPGRAGRAAGRGVVTLAAATVTASGTPGFLSPTGVEIAFVLVGLVTLGAALVTVTTRQLVHAALWLVVALGGLAVEYLLLTAEFIAWVQVLIYVGSVVVLLLFGLMLTRAPIGRSPDADSGNRWAALTVAVAAAVALVWVVVDAFRTTWIDLGGPAAGTTEVTGASLFRHWVLPFEALSVLLLAALVGAIVLSRKAKADAGPAVPGKEGVR